MCRIIFACRKGPGYLEYGVVLPDWLFEQRCPHLLTHPQALRPPSCDPSWMVPGLVGLVGDRETSPWRTSSSVVVPPLGLRSCYDPCIAALGWKSLFVHNIAHPGAEKYLAAIICVLARLFALMSMKIIMLVLVATATVWRKKRRPQRLMDFLCSSKTRNDELFLPSSLRDRSSALIF